MFREVMRKTLAVLHMEKFLHLSFWWTLMRMDKLTARVVASMKMDNLVNVLVDRMMPVILDKVVRIPSVTEKFCRLKDKIKGKETATKEGEENADEGAATAVTGAVKHIASNITDGIIGAVPHPSLRLKKTTSAENIEGSG